MSLIDLIDNIKESIEGDALLLMKLQEIIAESLGDELATALTVRFDEQLAKSSLQIYELKEIPAIREKLPNDVSQVRFTSDLTHTNTVDISTISEKNTFVANLIPRTLK